MKHMVPVVHLQPICFMILFMNIKDKYVSLKTELKIAFYPNRYWLVMLNTCFCVTSGIKLSPPY